MTSRTLVRLKPGKTNPTQPSKGPMPPAQHRFNGNGGPGKVAMHNGAMSSPAQPGKPTVTVGSIQAAPPKLKTTPAD